MRLNRFLAECGVASRRKSDELIAKGLVKINGKVVTELGVSVVPAKDTVSVEGVVIRQQHKGLLMFHKPKNVVSTLSDPEGRPTVADYLTQPYRNYFPVGRLDFETTGLMLFTNDGDLAEHLLHPRFEYQRRYEVTVEGRIPHGALLEIERGVPLDDGPARARIQQVTDKATTTVIELTVKEGRNRLIRRMFDQIGFPVQSLKRIAFGPFQLGTLRSGEIRKFTEREYHTARKKIVREE